MSEPSHEIKDSIVRSVIAQFAHRAAIGQRKYGTNLDRTDLPVLAWIQHAQEEHMDAILYLEKLKQMLGGSPFPGTGSAATGKH